MTYTITSNTSPPFSLQPASLDDEVLQNVRLLLSTRTYQIPLAREMGLICDHHGKPLPVAEALAFRDISAVLEKYEPRAELLNISFSHDHENGILIPTVEVKING